MGSDFEKLLVCEYKYWSVYLNQNQNYLGRCVVWCKRANALDLVDASPKEREELFEILSKLQESVKKSFGADWFNYAFLGNETRHLHGHFVPRYSSKVSFAGIIFVDKLFGHNYKTDHDFVVPEKILSEIMSKLIKNLR